MQSNNTKKYMKKAGESRKEKYRYYWYDLPHMTFFGVVGLSTRFSIDILLGYKFMCFGEWVELSKGRISIYLVKNV